MLRSFRKGPGGSGQQQAKKGGGKGPTGPGKGTPRLAKLQDAGEGLEALLGGEGEGGPEGVFANEEELVAKLMTQLQVAGGLAHSCFKC